MLLPPNHPNFDLVFHEINHPAIGDTPIDGNAPHPWQPRGRRDQGSHSSAAHGHASAARRGAADRPTTSPREDTSTTATAVGMSKTGPCSWLQTKVPGIFLGVKKEVKCDDLPIVDWRNPVDWFQEKISWKKVLFIKLIADLF